MKIPILVLTLVVIYGTYRTYAEENTGLIKEPINDGNLDLLNFPYPLEKSLSRNRRTILLSPIARIALRLTKFGSNVMVKTILDFAGFIYGALTGQNVCPKVEGLSLELIEKIFVHPIQTIETIICYSLQLIGRPGRALTVRLLHLSSQFIRKIFLPGLHTVLNRLASTGLLPPSLRVYVEMFNVFYRLLKIIGYVE